MNPALVIAALLAPYVDSRPLLELEGPWVVGNRIWTEERR
jgi:hypothetical protein